MKKSEAIAALTGELQKELEQMLRAAREAVAYATDAESKAETKWDTQGLEASYLAAGQAAQADEIADAIQSLQQIDTSRSLAMGEVGALMRCELGGEDDWFLLAMVGGGTSAKVRRTEVTLVTPDSPLARSLAGKVAGEEFSLPTGVKGKVLQVS